MNHQFQKLQKIGNFIGKPTFDGRPLYINSLPKSGTNFIESVFLEIGYKRAPCRCIVHDNQSSVIPKPLRSKFYLCHIPEAEMFTDERFQSIFIERRLWDCLKSYVNYMFIDTRHPISNFIKNSRDLEESVRQLFLSSVNPNGIALVDEYLKFYEYGMDHYDMVIDYDLFISGDQFTIEKVSLFLNTDLNKISSSIVSALETNSPTKNKGRVRMFENLNHEFLSKLKIDVELRVRNLLPNQIVRI